MDTVEIPENRIDRIADKISKSLDQEHGASWYADFRNNNSHYIIFLNKVFKLDRSKKSDYETMRQYGASIGIPTYQLPSYYGFDIQELHKFLVEAKKQTYANENIKKVVSLRPNSEDYHYENGDWDYHNTYFGGKKFLGKEVVYHDGGSRPQWGMNYYGFMLNDDLTEDVVDKALRPALMQIGEDKDILPVRGPKEFVNGEWKYTFVADGDLSNFTGLEEISKDSEVVYRLHCHGGFIK
ncbi:MAG: DUF5680 domain-containing protein [Deltaproteobacteria bacterium]|jgi:hypothetical protein|nr:DUF5680 domain-containing protein [Deltaproteobacteria bacterium]